MPGKGRYSKGLLALLGVLVLCAASHAITVDSLQTWAQNTFWGRYVPPDSLLYAYRLAVACGDFPTATFLAAGLSYILFGTIDSALCDIAYCLGKSGDISAARAFAKRALKLAPNSPQAIYVHALTLAWGGSFRKARKVLRKALAEAADTSSRNFFHKALGLVLTMRGDAAGAMRHFRRAEGISAHGAGKPMFQAKLFAQRIAYGAVVGSLYVREYIGKPVIVLRLRPTFKWLDGSSFSSAPMPVEQVCQLFGSPYFQRGVGRCAAITIPRWDGIPVGGEMSLWIVYVDEKGELDSTLVPVSGGVLGFPAADSFVVAVQELRRSAIRAWFDTLVKYTPTLRNPFWQFVLSFRAADALLDSSKWSAGEAFLDSVIAAAPYIPELYIWRGAFALFQQKYDTAYAYFSIPALRDSCNTDALYDAGVAKFLAGDYASAERLWRKALECNDKFAPAHLAMGVLYTDAIPDTQKAVEHYEKYLELSDYLAPEVSKWLQELLGR